MTLVLAPSRLTAGSVGDPGNAAAKPNGGRITSIKVLLKKVTISINEARAGCFSKQNPLAIKIDNVACILGTVNNKTTFDEIFFGIAFLKNVFSADVSSAAVFWFFSCHSI